MFRKGDGQMRTRNSNTQSAASGEVVREAASERPVPLSVKEDAQNHRTGCVRVGWAGVLDEETACAKAPRQSKF